MKKSHAFDGKKHGFNVLILIRTGAMVDVGSFDSVRKRFGYGLVKLSADLKIIDKNVKAESFRVFPKRGASIIPIVESGEKSLREMSDKRGDNAVVGFRSGLNRVNAFAIRDLDGGIMLLLHPLITSATLGRKGKMPIAYALNVLKIIYGERIEGRLSRREIFPLTSALVKNTVLVTTAMRNIAEKLSKTDFKSVITFDLGRTEAVLSSAVNFNSVIYALTELLALESAFSDGRSARIDFEFTQETVDIILTAAMKDTVSDASVLSRLFSEALLLFGISATVRFSSDGYVFARASVPTELATSTAREPSVLVDGALWGYFDYSMKYYGFGVKAE